MRKFIFSMLFVVVISGFGVSHVGAASLPDIPDIYQEEVNYLIEKNIINGFPDGTFKPDDNVTRAQAVTMIGAALHLSGGQIESSSFFDVNKDHYAFGYIEAAVKKQIIHGYTDGTFRPSREMNRSEMAIIISKAFNLTETSEMNFLDVSKQSSLYLPINKIYTAGITVGYENNTYRPNKTITRAEFSLMLARALDPSFSIDNGQELTTKYVNVNTSLNVRSGPGSSYSIIGSLYKNDEIKISSSNSDWLYMTKGNLKGYVHADYLVDKPIKDTKNRVIAIDAGHGGSDPGANGYGIIEKELNLSVSKYIEQYLKEENIKVVMTRTNDTYLSLGQRVDIAVNKKADAFVSIHGNAFNTESASGTETFFSTSAAPTRLQASEKLATFIQARLVKALGTKNRGVKQANFQVIKHNPLPAALVELGFMTNKSDANILKSKQREAAKAVKEGIVDYYNWIEKNN
ncbi:N-acetylmuramoyl-L-alanine amidase [Gracilibacillus boraciitolerans]|uniref:N-acetylmuramoyl-L-alanine amidase n=1 Tax=Gracilibacillus boraciitolerans TaxID=307521 RepID=UPI0006897CED|nr:N-acetylmuramoyl-L-alanine amidase [Gracilibacillus boraciitolerans]